VDFQASRLLFTREYRKKKNESPVNKRKRAKSKQERKVRRKMNTSEKFGIGGISIAVLMIALAFGSLFGKAFVALWNFLG